MNKLRLTALTITMSFLPLLMANTKIDNSNATNQVEHTLVVATINNENNEYVLDTFNEETRQDQEQFEYEEEKEKQPFVLEPSPYFYLLVAIALLIMPGLPIILAIIFAIRNKRRNRRRLENTQKE